MSRLGMTLTEENDRQLRDLRRITGMCKSFTIRRAVEVYHFLTTEKEAGAKVVLEYPDKPKVEVLFL